MQKLGYILLLFLFANSGNAQSSLEKSIDLLIAGKYQAAQDGFSYFLIDNPSHKTANICYGRALGLGGEKERAMELFQQLYEQDPQDVEIQLNLAESYLWNDLPRQALELYSTILKVEGSNFTANLGKGNALAADRKYSEALTYINKAMEIDPENEMVLGSKLSVQNALAYKVYKNGNYKEALETVNAVLVQNRNNPEALKILSMIQAGSRSSVSLSYRNQSDNGGNKDIARSVGFDFRLNGKHQVAMRFGDNNYSDYSETNRARTQFMSIGDKITLNAKTQLNLNYRLASNRSNDSQYSISTYSGGVERFWNSRFYSKLKYGKENQDYNIELLDSRISMDHYSLSNNINIAEWLGWYSELVYTDQSDNNTRNLLFTSVYFQLGNKPNLKVGYNFNYISFSERSTSYFSPGTFRANEFFVQVTNQDHAQVLGYHINMAVGQQQVESKDQQITARVDAKLHWHIKKRFVLGAQYLYNNAASATALGQFTSQTIGIELIMHLN